MLPSIISFAIKNNFKTCGSCLGREQSSWFLTKLHVHLTFHQQTNMLFFIIQIKRLNLPSLLFSCILMSIHNTFKEARTTRLIYNHSTFISLVLYYIRFSSFPYMKRLYIKKSNSIIFQFVIQSVGNLILLLIFDKSFLYCIIENMLSKL